MSFTFNPFTSNFDKVGSGSSADPYVIVAVSSNVTLTSDATHLVDTSAARSLTLPTPVSGRFVRVKDSTGNANTNNITIVRSGSEEIETVAASYVINSDFAEYTFVSDGVDWFIL